MKSFIALLMFGLYFCPVHAADLVAIVVGNTLPRENNVGREHDVMKMIDELEKISEYTGLKLDLTLYIHEEYNSKLLTKLEKISVNQDDVLFFYYSGHGYRESDKPPEENPWPNIHIDLEKKGIDHKVITEILQEKGPRLLFSLVNSCNNITDEKIELVRRGVSFEKPSSVQENYKKLFLEHSGTIVSSSSIPGQYSYRNPEKGTLYLEGFLNALHEEVKREGELSWEAIFLRTIDNVQLMSNNKQIPQYKISLK